MADLTTDKLRQVPASGTRALPGGSARILVLEPAHSRPDQAAVLLDGRELSIGSDADCDLCLPNRGVASRHAVIVTTGRQIVIRANDRRTWVNGFPATETILRDGDVLAVGPIEFRLRRATADDMPPEPPAQSARLPIATPTDETPRSAAPEPVIRKPAASLPAAEHESFLAARSELESRLAQMEAEQAHLADEKIRLASARAQLEAEQGEWDAVRLALETDRAQLDSAQSEIGTQRAQIEADRQRFIDELAAVSADIKAQADIDLVRSDLDAERRELDSFRAELDADCANLQVERQALESQRSHDETERLRRDAEQLERNAAQERLASERKHLESERRLLESHRAELHASRRELEARESELELQRSECDNERLQWEADRPNAESAREELDTARIDLETERRELEAYRAELEAGRLEFEAERADFKVQRLQFESERKQWESKRATIEVARHELDAAQSDLERERRELQEKRSELETARRDLDVDRSESEALRRRLESERSRIEAAQAQIVADRDQLAAARKQHAAAEARWAAERSQATSEIETARSTLESERAQFEQDREQLEFQRQEAAAGPPEPVMAAAGRSDAISPFDPAAILTSEERQPFQGSTPEKSRSEPVEPAESPFSQFEPARALGTDPEPLKKGWTNDADRFSRFFRQTRAAAPAVPVVAPDFAPVLPPPEIAPDPSPAPGPEERLAAEHSEVCNSVADYMQQLLARNPGARSRSEQPDHVRETVVPAVRTRETTAESGPAPTAIETPTVVETAPTEEAQPVATRRKHDVNEIRAGFGSLRQIANLSARTAVAAHSSRRLKKAVVLMLPLTIISFVLAGGMLLLGGSAGLYFHHACGTAVVGVIAGIALINSLATARRDRKHAQSAEKNVGVESSEPAPAETAIPTKTVRDAAEADRSTVSA